MLHMPLLLFLVWWAVEGGKIRRSISIKANWTSATHRTKYAKLSVKPGARAWGQGCSQAVRERGFHSGPALHSLRVNKVKWRQGTQFCEAQTFYNLRIHFKKKSTK